MSITPESLLTACDDFNITLKSSDTSRDDEIAEIEMPPQRELPSDWLELYDRLSPEQKNVLWKTTLDHIVVDHDRVHLVFESAKVLAERMSMLKTDMPL